ncbi:MAG TPA: PilX N-terminal domain-containing pilus assembly protein [bacterium]
MSRRWPCATDRRLYRGDSGRAERGASLVTALLLLLTLSLLGVMALNSSRIDTRIVSNTLGPQQARQTAEMGLGWAQEQLRQQRGEWNTLLASRPPGADGWIQLLAAALPAGVTIPAGVQVFLRDDDDLDNSATQDTNGVILVRVRGASGNPTDRDYVLETLEAAFQRPGFDTSYAQQGGDAGNTGVN